MTLQDILDIVEEIGEIDEERRDTFAEELDEAGATEQPYQRTRELIDQERAKLDALGELLEDERENIDDVVDYTEVFTVEQAVEHRNKAVEKLEAHNEQLETFRQSMLMALDIIEDNLDRLETEGPEALQDSPEPHLETARDAIKRHNEVVTGLGKNMTILSAYMLEDP